MLSLVPESIAFFISKDEISKERRSTRRNSWKRTKICSYRQKLPLKSCLPESSILSWWQIGETDWYIASILLVPSIRKNKVSVCHKSTIKTKKKKIVFSLVYLFAAEKAVLQGLKFWKENELLAHVITRKTWYRDVK